MKVAVIGGAGFLGSHMVRALLAAGHEPVVVDNLSVGQKKWIPEGVQFIEYDITKAATRGVELVRLFEKCQWVMNYAAMPFVPDSYKWPCSVIASNFTGAVNCMIAAEAAGVDRFLQISSAEVYGNQEGGTSLDENSSLYPLSTYGLSKVAIDRYARISYYERDLPIITLRQFNCIGERETHPYVLPEILTQLSRSTNLKLGTNSNRDFMYAGDAVRMALELIEKGEPGQAYNLGSERSISIYSLAILAGEVVSKPDVEITYESARKRKLDLMHLKSNNAKIYSVIDSRPTVTLEEAIYKTWQYFVSNESKWDFKEVDYAAL